MKANEFKAVILGHKIQDYNLFDLRSMKPKFYEKADHEGYLIQELDQCNLDSDTGLKYFIPNSISLSISVCKKNMDHAKHLYRENILPNSGSDLITDKIDINKINDVSTLVYDFLELVQTSIVFAYISLESFANLSIPEDYQFKKSNNKGIEEIYNKGAIERWITLDQKLSIILKEIYKTNEIKTTKIWKQFKYLEALRHQIIHQKSIVNIEYFKMYFNPKIFEISTIPNEVISFYENQHMASNQTNPIWPFKNSTINTIPSTKYNSQIRNF